MNKFALKNLPVLALLSGMMFSAVVTAAPKDNQQLTDEVAATQKSLNEIQADMKKLKRLLDNRAMLELFQRMDDLADEVSSLRGMMEQQGHDLAGLKKRQRELYLDVDRRLRDLVITSPRTPSAVAPETSPPAAVVPAEAVNKAPEPEMPKQPSDVTPVVKTPVVAPVVAVLPTTSTNVSKPATVSVIPKAPVSKEREDYQNSFDMLKEGRYKMATTSFKRFINTYPQSSYAGNSQYWLGEANYVTRQFEQAVTEFKKVLDQYPTSNKVPDAMLKLGYTYYEIRANDKAKVILSKLRKAHPKSTAARLAGKRLERMRKEGL